MIELVSNPDPGARIKVIGAGGCGGNAVNHMINVGLQSHLSLGCAQAGVDIVRSAADRMALPALIEAAEALEAELTACRAAAELCRSRGADISFLGMQFALAQQRIPSTLTGAARKSELEVNLRAMTAPIDQGLLADVMEVLDPVRDQTWPCGNWKG